MRHFNKAIGILGSSPAFQLSGPCSRRYQGAPFLVGKCLSGNADCRRQSPSYPAPARLYSTVLSRPRFSFRIGVAFSAKNSPFNPRTDLFSFDPAKDDQKINTGRQRSGQDAFFVSKVAGGSNVAFGVADGVGGWIDSGIDSAHFSHGLCKYMAQNAKEFKGSSNKIRAGALLQQGYEGLVDDSSISGGGSTACVAVAKSDGHVEVAK
jgi:protein phosphatase PTC7